MQRRLVAQDVANKLGDVERQIDQTLAAAGLLIASLPTARERARLSAVVGQDALDLVVQATATLAQARGKLVAAHNALAETGRQIGVGKVLADYGTKTVPPSGANEPGVVTSLRAGEAA